MFGSLVPDSASRLWRGSMLGLRGHCRKLAPAVSALPMCAGGQRESLRVMLSVRASQLFFNPSHRALDNALHDCVGVETFVGLSRR